MRRFTIVALAVALAVASGAVAASASTDNRENRLLKQLPKVPGSSASTTQGDGRSFSVAVSASDVLTFYRAKLGADGWDEVASVGKSPADKSESATNGESKSPAESDRIDAQSSGHSSSRSDSTVSATKTRWTRGDTRFTLVIKSSASGASDVSEPAADQTDYRLKVRAPEKATTSGM